MEDCVANNASPTWWKHVKVDQICWFFPWIGFFICWLKHTYAMPSRIYVISGSAEVDCWDFQAQMFTIHRQLYSLYFPKLSNWCTKMHGVRIRTFQRSLKVNLFITKYWITRMYLLFMFKVVCFMLHTEISAFFVLVRNEVEERYPFQLEVTWIRRVKSHSLICHPNCEFRYSLLKPMLCSTMCARLKAAWIRDQQLGAFYPQRETPTYHAY